MSDKLKVLFVCIHNSARSQIAEAFLKYYAPDIFEVSSAGLSPGVLNPYVVQVMKEVGIDISSNKPKSIEEILSAGEDFDYIISVCEKSLLDGCVNICLSNAKKISWEFDDPSSFKGSEKDILEKVRIIRDQIKSKVLEWVSNMRVGYGNK